jgi:aminopeptidase N
VESQDLMDAFTATMARYGRNDFDFDRAFRTWETQKGYPIITVRYMQPGGNFVVTQERFFQDKNLGVNDTTSFYIPLNFATASNSNFEDTTITDFFVDGAPSLSIPVSGLNNNQWFIFNKKQRGYYRVNYEESNWRLISEALSTATELPKIHVMNRAQLIDDSFALVQAKYLDDYQTAYDVLKYLIHEDDYFPWYVANRYLAPLRNVYGLKNEILNVSRYSK